jgi:hypothetical protein
MQNPQQERERKKRYEIHMPVTEATYEKSVADE